MTAVDTDYPDAVQRVRAALPKASVKTLAAVVDALGRLGLLLDDDTRAGHIIVWIDPAGRSPTHTQDLGQGVTLLRCGDVIVAVEFADAQNMIAV
jgi:hypothetical protein